jgi:hypothetical protein
MIIYRVHPVVIQERVKRNFFWLSSFIALHIVKNLWNCYFGKLLSITSLSVIFLYLLLPSVAFFSFIVTKLVFFTCFYFFIIPVSIALEESLHMGICIRQGKTDSIKSLSIIQLDTQQHNSMLMISAATKFCGKFTLSEKIQIHGGAPLLSLLFMCVVFIMTLSFTRAPIGCAIWFLIILIIFPIGSLLPIKFIFESDGNCIINCAQHLGLSIHQTIKELLHGIFFGLQYIFLGSQSEDLELRT